MDDFTYNLELGKIESCKYIKDTRALLYDYADRFETYYWPDSKNLDFYSKKYKLYSKIYYKFINSSKTELPEKFMNKLISFQRILLNTITLDNSITYEYFMDIFQYTEHITIPNLNNKKFKKLCNIIEDNPFPFRHSIKVNTSILYTSGYFSNLDDNRELTILSWMKSNNIPESNTLAQLFRTQCKYQNTQQSHDDIIAGRANLVLAIEAIDQLTGVPIVQQ